MISGETIGLLRQHAGLQEPDDASSPTISASTAPGSARREELDAALGEFVAALATLNHELNGAVPSEEIRSQKVLPTEVAYATAEVMRMLREAGAERGTWLVETAWLAVLAGDVDDLLQHLAAEEAAAQPT